MSAGFILAMLGILFFILAMALSEIYTSYFVEEHAGMGFHTESTVKDMGLDNFPWQDRNTALLPFMVFWDFYVGTVACLSDPNLPMPWYIKVQGLCLLASIGSFVAAYII